MTDVSNDAWRKQEAAVLSELTSMGLSDKPIVTIWNKIDKVPETKEYLKLRAEKLNYTVPLSAKTGEGFTELVSAIEYIASSQMEALSCYIPYEMSSTLSVIHRLGVISTVKYLDEYIFVEGRVPRFLFEQIVRMSEEDDEDEEVGEEGLVYRGEESSLFGLVDGSLSLKYAEDLPGLDELAEVGEEKEEEYSMAIGSAKRSEKKRIVFDRDLIENPARKHVTINSGMSKREDDDDDIDWVGLAKGRHSAVRKANLVQFNQSHVHPAAAL